jgi:hypothetical protein
LITLGIGVKRIVYSIYTNEVDEHTSTNDFKKSQFKKYKENIIKSQKDYANLCNADYKLFNTKITNYDNIQFEKIFLLENLCQEYDEILYLDFDVIPQTEKIIFNEFDLNTICGYFIKRIINIRELPKKYEYSPLNIFIKMCCKRAMLLIDDIHSDNSLLNTGILLANKDSIKKLKFKERFENTNKVYEEALNDNLYSEDISKCWKPNNEVYMSYLIERYNIPYTNIGIQWNFMLNKECPEPTAGAHMLHHVNKEFQLSYSSLTSSTNSSDI